MLEQNNNHLMGENGEELVKATSEFVRARDKLRKLRDDIIKKHTKSSFYSALRILSGKSYKAEQKTSE